jgi:hypothetical protein
LFIHTQRLEFADSYYVVVVVVVVRVHAACLRACGVAWMCGWGARVRRYQRSGLRRVRVVGFPMRNTNNKKSRGNNSSATKPHD